MKRLSVIASALFVVVLGAACSEQSGMLNNALDADRNAREKMTSALALMTGALVLEKEDTVEAREIAEQKRADAVDAYNLAIESWQEAKQIYDELIGQDTGNPNYLNNYANMLYYQARSGMEVDYAAIGKLLNTAIAMEDRPNYRRNLELLEDLGSDEEVSAEVDKNRNLVDELRSASE